MTIPVAPPLLVAARTKFLDSEAFSMLYAQDVIGRWQQPPQPWVFVGDDPRNGLPWAYGLNQAAVSFHLGRDWTTSITTASFPTLGVTVWALADPATGSAEWLARDVGSAVIAEFHDPAQAKPKQWTADAYVISCAYNGDLSCIEAEGVNGLFRADLSFECQTP